MSEEIRIPVRIPMDDKVSIVEMLFEKMKPYFPKPNEEVRDDDNKKLMSRMDTLSYLGIGNTTLYKLVKDKEIPASKFQRKLFFRREDLDKWISKNIINQ